MGISCNLYKKQVHKMVKKRKFKMKTRKAGIEKTSKNSTVSSSLVNTNFTNNLHN